MTEIDPHVAFTHINSIATHFNRISRIMRHAPHLQGHKKGQWNLKLNDIRGNSYHYDIEGGGRYFYELRNKRGYYEIWAEGLHVEAISGHRGGIGEIVFHQGDLDDLTECAKRIETIYKDMKTAAPWVPVR